MKVRLAKVSGIPIEISDNWMMFVGLMSLITVFSSGLMSAVNTLLVMLFLTSFVILHELGHALTALQFGAKTNVISLHFLGGAAQVSEAGWFKLLAKPFNAMLVWMAGPAVSILLYFALTLPLRYIGTDTYITHGMAYLGNLNLFIAIFNLMPVYPLDGGGILYCLMRFMFSKATAIRITSVVGIIGSILFLIAAFKFRAIMLGIIGIMALLASYAAPKHRFFQ